MSLNIELLKKSGVDYDAALHRCVNNESLYQKILTTFISDESRLTLISEAYEQKDYETLKLRVHDLKGTSGNLSIIPLFEISSHTMDILRSNDYTKLPECVEQLKKQFTDSVNAIKESIIAD